LDWVQSNPGRRTHIPSPNRLNSLMLLPIWSRGHPWYASFHFSFLIPRQSVGFPRSKAASYTNRIIADIHAFSRIRTHDFSVRALDRTATVIGSELLLGRYLTILNFCNVRDCEFEHSYVASDRELEVRYTDQLLQIIINNNRLNRPISRYFSCGPSVHGTLTWTTINFACMSRERCLLIVKHRNLQWCQTSQKLRCNFLPHIFIITEPETSVNPVIKPSHITYTIPVSFADKLLLVLGNFLVVMAQTEALCDLHFMCISAL
jgi:hypothetical protein